MAPDDGRWLRQAEFDRTLALLQRGETRVLIVGPTGSGKRTLLGRVAAAAPAAQTFQDAPATWLSEHATGARVATGQTAHLSPAIALLRLHPVADDVAGPWLERRVVDLGGRPPVVTAALLGALRGLPALLERAARRLVTCRADALAAQLHQQPGLLLDDEDGSLAADLRASLEALPAPAARLLAQLAWFRAGASLAELDAPAGPLRLLIDAGLVDLDDDDRARLLPEVARLLARDRPPHDDALAHTHARVVLGRPPPHDERDLTRIAEALAPDLRPLALEAAILLGDPARVAALVARPPSRRDLTLTGERALARLCPERSVEHLERAVALAEGALAADLHVDLGVSLQARHDLGRARTMYERACASPDASRTTRARALLNLATVLHDEVRLDEAREAYERLLPEAEGKVLGATWLNHGVLLHEEGSFAQAARSLTHALAQFRSLGEDRLAGIAQSSLGAVQHEQGSTEAAIASHRAAEVTLAATTDARSLALCRLRLSLALTDAGLDAAAELGAASAHVLRSAEPPLRHVLRLTEAYVLWRTGQLPAANPLALAHAPADTPTTDDARFVARLLRRQAGPGGDSSGGLQLDHERREVILPGGERHSFDRHPHAFRLLGALHAAQPDALSLRALWDAGWPGEKAAEGAWQNRVHVALSFLRRTGLRNWLQRDEAGYRLLAR